MQEDDLNLDLQETAQASVGWIHLLEYRVQSCAVVDLWVPSNVTNFFTIRMTIVLSGRTAVFS